MKDIYWIIKNILKVTFSMKKNYFIYFILPLFGIILGISSYATDKNSLNIGVLNNDTSYVARDTINYLSSIGKFKLHDVSKNSIDKDVVSGKVDCVVILNRDFGKSVLDRKPSNIEIKSIKGKQATGFVKSYLYNHIDNISKISEISKGDKNKLSLLYKNYIKSETLMKSKEIKDSSLNKDITIQTLGFLVFISLISSSNISKIILKERREKTFLRISCSPIGFIKYLVSNLIVNVLILSVQNIMTLVILENILHISTGVPFLTMLSVLTLFSIVSVGISLAIVSISKNSDGVSILQIFIFVITSQISGCFFNASYMPEYMQKISDFLPQKWILDTISKLQMGANVTMEIAVLVTFAIVFFLLTVYGFKKINDVRDFV